MEGVGFQAAFTEGLAKDFHVCAALSRILPEGNAFGRCSSSAPGLKYESTTTYGKASNVTNINATSTFTYTTCKFFGHPVHERSSRSVHE